ncbi:MAG: Coq4 family protein [Pontixanthobacter sp.]
MTQLNSIDGTTTETARDGTLFRHPDRPVLKKRPMEAYRHFRELLKDKEDTTHVFKIFEAFPSAKFLPAARAFALSERGEAIRASEPYLPTILDDHATLRRLPRGSVAHAYCDFMESEGLTAAGLVAEEDKTWGERPQYDDLVSWYANRRRDTHDMLHVLTGYGRDALGEQCVLAFTHGQNSGFANVFIAYLGALNIRQTTPGKAPVLRAVRQAQKAGRGAPRVADMALRDLLAMPLDDARAMMKIGDPSWYRACHEYWTAAGIDPYDLLGNAGDNTRHEAKAA